MTRTELHAEEALIPALNNLADASLVRERLLARVLGRPELLARLLDDASRVHGDGRARLHGSALAGREDIVHGAIAARCGSAHDLKLR